MVATVILGMLCVHLLCFCVMFGLISTRLHGKKMGMGVFAWGNCMLAVAYILQLLEGEPGWSLMSVVNHTLTLCAPVAYLIGAFHYFDRMVPVAKPLAWLAVLYVAAQCAVQWAWGDQARHALLSLSCTILFFGMTFGAIKAARTFARTLRVEMLFFAILICGICILNAIKMVTIVTKDMAALDMNSTFQMVFYVYMSFLGTVLPPCAVWLVLRRLTDELHALAVQDPLTQLLNRRGMQTGVEAHFRARQAGPAHVLLLDIDHFKQINDTYGHKMGDKVICKVAEILRTTARHGDLICRIGGEEFVVICLHSDAAGAMQLAERILQSIQQCEIPGVSLLGTIRCTVTIGISESFAQASDLEARLQQADVALYQGKTNGRNCVSVWGNALHADVLPAKVKKLEVTEQ